MRPGSTRLQSLRPNQIARYAPVPNGMLILLAPDDLLRWLNTFDDPKARLAARAMLPARLPTCLHDETLRSICWEKRKLTVLDQNRGRSQWIDATPSTVES